MDKTQIMHSILIVAIAAIVTAATRFLPFLLFPAGKKTPKVITYLSSVLPFAIIGMLVVYCLKDVGITSYPYGIPELIAIVAVVALHLWKKNTLLSVAGGTVLYMVLVQVVFV